MVTVVSECYQFVNAA